MAKSRDFEDFLNNLQDWDGIRVGGEGSNSHARTHSKGVVSSNSAKEAGARRKASPAEAKKQILPTYEFPRKISDEATKYISIGLGDDESPPTAASEKELGNEFFKKKEFSMAIDCYARSIALSPSSVAYANRAMCYIKLKRYEEAEADCTEALNLDDRYVKAYSRRATARKELGKLTSSLEDSGFALRLEPNNPELKKLYAATRSLIDLEHSRRISESGKGAIASVDRSPSDGQKITTVADLPSGQVSPLSSVKKIEEATKHGQRRRVSELASRAAELAASAIPERISTPRSAYELEASWRLTSGDPVKQARLLKSVPPDSFPRLFKNALSAPMLFEIVKTAASFFKEDMELAVGILDNLTKVPRFEMILMCLSAADRMALRRMWDEVFRGAEEHAEALTFLRKRYCLAD